MQSDISTFAGLLRDHAPTGPDQPTDVDGGGATGRARQRPSSTSRRCFRWRPRRTSRSTRAVPRTASIRLQQDHQRRHGQDRQRELDEWLRGLRRPVLPGRREHAVPGRCDGGAVDFRGLGRPGRAGLQHQRRDRRDDGHQSGGPGRRPLTGTLYIANKSSNTLSVDSEGTTSNPTNFATAGSVDRPGRVPTPSRWTRRPARSSWPTPRTAP